MSLPLTSHSESQHCGVYASGRAWSLCMEVGLMVGWLISCAEPHTKGRNW